MSLTIKGFTKSTPQIYRDCLRLVKHIAGNSAKGLQLNKIIRNEFKKNKDATDNDIIEKLKSNAVRGLSNYLMMESSAKDERFQKHSTSFVRREAESLRENKETN